MPGIFGAYKRIGKEELTTLMEGMIAAMDRDGSFRVDRYQDEMTGLFAGRVSLGILNPFDQPISIREGQGWIIFHGECYDSGPKAGSPEKILRDYFRVGESCAADLNGIFHFVIYDGRSKELKLFSDKFGLQPLYYTLSPHGILFAAEVRALLADPACSKGADYSGLADFLHFGQILGQKTLFKDIKVLPPGSVLTYNLQEQKADLNSYWKLEQLFAEKGNYDTKASPGDVVPSLVEAVKARTRNRELLGLSLSGGLDSRGILAGLGTEARGIFTYTLGLEGCADQGLAQRMAEVAGTKHEFIVLDQSYLGNYEKMAQNMIFLSDGLYHPHESTEMLALEYFKRSPFRILLRGHGGETAKAALAYPIMVNPEVYALSGSRRVLDYILRTTNMVIRDIDPDRLFNGWFSEIMREGPRASLEESSGKAAEVLAPADVCIYYYIQEHIRRQVVASLEIFRSRIEIRMPYVDETYLRNLFRLPLKFRNYGEIHLDLVKHCLPALIKIPNSNTGAPLDAGPFRLWVTDKFNSLMKRLSVKGFRHYTEFQKWHRDQFREGSRKILFSDQAASRNIYKPDYLKTLFEEHLSGKKDYGHLLGTMTGLEIWFRIFVDESPPAQA